MLTLVTTQSLITADVRTNGAHIRDAMQQAAASGARLVHFPEGALSGYAPVFETDWARFAWRTQQTEFGRIAALARRLHLWVVLGVARRRPRALPQNCLAVISDEGRIVHWYAKRICSNTELTYWYSPGNRPVVFEVDGLRFGCALCIEVVFPHLFAEYERLGVACVLLSSYGQDPVHSVMARAHAATNCFWLSLATPVACSASMPATQFGPDGGTLSTSPAGVPSLLKLGMDPADRRYRLALDVARPWRAHTRVHTTEGMRAG